MMDISFLHFTDLHLGQHGFDHYWPTYKAKLREDLKKLRKQVGKDWDFVLFTGDLAFSGLATEYGMLTDALQEIWHWFREDGFEPLLIPIPGNHDLTRLDESHPVGISLGLWEEKHKLRETFWNNDNSEYRKTIREAFKGYTNWIESKPVRMPDNFQYGIMPGDFSLSLSIDGFNLGIVGLNSAFLQLTPSNFIGKTILSSKQIHPIMDSSPDDWCKKHHFNILMTHHGPSWLSESSLREFKAEIYPPDRFNLHLFGHLHDANGFEVSEGGASARRYRQGPSLLGLEKYGTNGEVRVHGYSANKLELRCSSGVESYWPRILVEKAGGHHGFDFDTKFERDSNDSVCSTFTLCQNIEFDMSKTEPEIFQAEYQKINSDDEIHLVAENDVSLKQHFTTETTQKRINIPKFNWKIHSQHQSIRQAEQASLEKSLLEKRCGIIVSDWGLGKIGFIGTVLGRLEKNNPIEVFKISCNEAESLVQIDSVFRQQFGFSFHETMNFLSNLSKPILFMDDFSPYLLEEISSQSHLENFLQPLLDFCPTLSIILSTRLAPKNPSYDVITLCALEIPDTKLYIQNHEIKSEELNDPSIIESIHLKSDGLPMHLDMIIEQLQVSSLYEILASNDKLSAAFNESEPIPIALQRAVGSLTVDNDRYKIRSYKLLQVLSFLPAGESLSELKRVFPRDPFFPQNAVDLLKLDLIQTETPIEITQNEGHAGNLFRGGMPGEEKKLVVPRQIRDYVNSITSEDESIDITRAMLFLMFGDNWLSGNATLQNKKKQPLREASLLGPGNEHAVVISYLRQSIKEDDQSKTRKAIALAISLTSSYANASRYRDCAVVAGEYLAVSSEVIVEEERKHLSTQLAKGLRMTKKKEDALALLDSIIETNEDSLTNREIAELELLRALTLETTDDKNGALEAAYRVLEHAPKGTSRHDHALSTIIGLENSGKDRLTKLAKHESAARERGHIVVANNIALDISSELTDEAAKSEILDTVIKCKEDSYNRIRALVKKGELANIKGSSITLKDSEKIMLGQAYSFQFTQRLGNLFDSCHRVLWKTFSDAGNVRSLLFMFRLSSFVWRLNGDIDSEKEYVRQMPEIKEKELNFKAQEKVVLALDYFKKRLGFIGSKSEK